MARLQKFSGTQALPGVGSPQVVADTAVGAARANLGTQIGRAAATFGELAETAVEHHAAKRKQAERKKQAARADELAKRKNAFTGIKAAESLQREVRQRLIEPRKGSSETPVPLADEMVEYMKATEAKIFSGLPEEQKHSFDRAAALGEDQLRTEIAYAEDNQDKAYFLDGIKQTKDLAVETVSRLPHRIDQAFGDFLDLVDTAHLSQPQKEQFIEGAGREILEAWVQAHPAETQIAELSNLQARTTSGVATISKDAGAVGAGKEEQTEFAARAVALPEVSRNRLLATALKQQTETALVEQARIAERIDSIHEQIDPLEISGNAFLGNQARLQLLNRFRKVVDTRSRNVSALERLASAGNSGPRPTDEQGFVGDALSYLGDGKTDPATLMRGIAVSSVSLPRIAGKTLVKNLASENSEDVLQAFATLSVLKPDAEKTGLDGAEGAQIRTLQAGETYLTAEHGLSTEAAGALFAKANQVKIRKERLETFAALYSGKRSGKKTAFPLIG